MKKVPKSAFKPKAFEYFRMVEEQGEPVIVTDHGRDAVRIEPILPHAGSSKDALKGSILRYEAPEEPVGEGDWEAQE
mgnify:FL=1